MIHEFIETFMLIFIAELGDKTQVMLMTLATRYSAFQVLFGIFIGVLLNHGIAIIIGSYISDIVELDLLQIFSGFVFIVFGFLALIDDCNEKEKKGTFSGGPILTVAIAFFLGELGDKTQLTAMTLSMEAQYHFIVLAGSVCGMLVIGFIGIIVGSALTKHVPSYIMKIISGIIFIIFGLHKLFNTYGIFVNNSANKGILIVIVGFITSLQISKLTVNR